MMGGFTNWTRNKRPKAICLVGRPDRSRLLSLAETESAFAQSATIRQHPISLGFLAVCDDFTIRSYRRRLTPAAARSSNIWSDGTRTVPWRRAFGILRRCCARRFLPPDRSAARRTEGGFRAALFMRHNHRVRSSTSLLDNTSASLLDNMRPQSLSFYR
jgi:hypothetical protein